MYQTLLMMNNQFNPMSKPLIAVNSYPIPTQPIPYILVWAPHPPIIPNKLHLWHNTLQALTIHLHNHPVLDHLISNVSTLTIYPNKYLNLQHKWRHCSPLQQILALARIHLPTNSYHSPILTVHSLIIALPVSIKNHLLPNPMNYLSINMQHTMNP